jgi:hypothetical protein
MSYSRPINEVLIDMPSSIRARLNNVIPLMQRAEVLLAKGPVYLYTYGRWRLDGWWRQALNRILTACGQDRGLGDAAFFARLDLTRPGLAEVRETVTQRDFAGARSSLAAYFCARQSPRFHFCWHDRTKILELVQEEQKEETMRAADRVCQNTFCFRHIPPVRFENGIDWAHRPGGNTDWTWDLNRHPYFITLGKAYWYTGKRAYAHKFSELLLDWIDANPVGVGRRNWDSILEVAVRLNTWIWAYFFFSQAGALGQHEHTVLLKGLFSHARYLAARTEHHAANNHLLLEAKALAFCGLLFPEFREARAWRTSGLRILWDQVRKQVCIDGTHGERAPLYHRRVLSDLIEMLVLLEHNGLPAPEDVVDRVERMIDFDVNITKPDGTIPLFSDSALTEIQARFSNRGGGATVFGRVKLDGDGLSEDMAWLLGGRDLGQNTIEARSDRELASRAFPQGGYFVMRAGTGKAGLYLAFDCGPFGYEAGPIHGHADALSFDLYAYGRSLITDCGVYSYHLGDDWRNYFRGTRAHNTIVVDGQDQSTLLGSGRVYRMAQATLHKWTSGTHCDFVDGSHDGYCRLAEPVTHRRKVFFVKPEYWIVIDLLTGPSGRHRLEQYFHLMPWATVALDGETGSVHVEEGGIPVLTIAPLNTSSLQVDIISGATDPIQGWVSFFSGERVAAPVLRYRKDVQVPTSFVTVLYPHPPGHVKNIHVTDPRSTAYSDEWKGEMGITGVAVETSEHIDICTIACGSSTPLTSLAGSDGESNLVYVRRQKSNGAVIRVIRQP